MKTVNQTKIYRTHKGEWVILDIGRTKVLSADKELNIAISKFRKKFGEKKIPLTFKVPSKIVPYIGC